jgi:osmotically-inducible protein OsmY
MTKDRGHELKQLHRGSKRNMQTWITGKIRFQIAFAAAVESFVVAVVVIGGAVGNAIN